MGIPRNNKSIYLIIYIWSYIIIKHISGFRCFYVIWRVKYSVIHRFFNMSAPISGVRIRLSFESPSSDSSLCDLPTNCWFLVRNNSQTISDIMAQLIHRFFSREKQPSVQLFLDNHVLPVWESVDILRENDSVTVTVRCVDCCFVGYRKGGTITYKIAKYC